MLTSLPSELLALILSKLLPKHPASLASCLRVNSTLFSPAKDLLWSFPFKLLEEFDNTAPYLIFLGSLHNLLLTKNPRTTLYLASLRHIAFPVLYSYLQATCTSLKDDQVDTLMRVILHFTTSLKELDHAGSQLSLGTISLAMDLHAHSLKALYLQDPTTSELMILARCRKLQNIVLECDDKSAELLLAENRRLYHELGNACDDVFEPCLEDSLAFLMHNNRSSLLCVSLSCRMLAWAGSVTACLSTLAGTTNEPSPPLRRLTVSANLANVDVRILSNLTQLDSLNLLGCTGIVEEQLIELLQSLGGTRKNGHRPAFGLTKLSLARSSHIGAAALLAIARYCPYLEALDYSCVSSPATSGLPSPLAPGPVFSGSSSVPSKSKLRSPSVNLKIPLTPATLLTFLKTSAATKNLKLLRIGACDSPKNGIIKNHIGDVAVTLPTGNPHPDDQCMRSEKIDDMILVARLLRDKVPKLETLGLTAAGIDDEVLVKGLLGNPEDCRYRDSLRLASPFPSLRDLDLRGNRRLSDISLFSFSHSDLAIQLDKIDIQGEGVTERGILAFREVVSARRKREGCGLLLFNGRLLGGNRTK